jgi:predicted NodU family carbamoyl transferase
VRILRIAAYDYDSAEALVADGDIAKAAQEQRLTRKERDASLPRHPTSRRKKLNQE